MAESSGVIQGFLFLEEAQMAKTKLSGQQVVSKFL
jgi:hypothetical protein